MFLYYKVFTYIPSIQFLKICTNIFIISEGYDFNLKLYAFKCLHNYA